MRLIHESRMHDENCFVTLTYSQQLLPQNLSLDKRHWQLFAKRLRKHRGPFRFFHVGEYGENTLRPHYHALLFGLSFSDSVLLRDGRYQLFVSPSLERFWGLGYAVLGAVNWETASYVARYCVKKFDGPHRADRYTRVNRETGETWEVEPEYCTMSRRPNGIGATWFERWKDEVFPADEVASVPGRSLSRVPRYYSSLLERSDPAAFAEVKAARRERVKSVPRRLQDARDAARDLHNQHRLQMKGAKGSL